jgi:hypothetical protein
MITTRDLGLFMIYFKGITASGPMTITYTTLCSIVQLAARLRCNGLEPLLASIMALWASSEQNITIGSDTISYFYKYACGWNWTNIQSGSGSTTLQPGQKLPWTIELNADGVLEMGK